MTLIEVLVAFVVLSLTMAVIMQIFSGGLYNARLTHDYSRALFLAESKLAAVGVEHPLVTGEDGGQVDSDLQWRVVVTPYADGGEAEQLAMPVRLYEVRVRVGWSEGGQERRVELATLRLGPKQ
jgi:general secretion pathway protein I